MSNGKIASYERCAALQKSTESEPHSSLAHVISALTASLSQYISCLTAARVIPVAFCLARISPPSRRICLRAKTTTANPFIIPNLHIDNTTASRPVYDGNAQRILGKPHDADGVSTQHFPIPVTALLIAPSCFARINPHHLLATIRSRRHVQSELRTSSSEGSLSAPLRLCRCLRLAALMPHSTNPSTSCHKILARPSSSRLTSRLHNDR